MGDSPVSNTLKNVAGYGVGTLAALDTIKGGGLGSYLMNRQRLMSDPGFRSTLAGSPFASGVFGVSGGMGGGPPPAAPGLPGTAGGGAVAQPAEMVGPPPPGVRVAQPGELPTPTQYNVPGYEPGTPRMWQPNLPPYDPKTGLEQQGLATAALGVQSPDAGMRAQSKMAAGIPLNDQEIVAATSRARAVQALGGQGTVVKLDIPGMQTNVGSPYNITAVGADEYPTAALAAAAAAAKGPGWTVQPSGRGTFLLSPPPTQQQMLPPQLPAPVRAGTPAGAPPTAPAPVRLAPPPPVPAPVTPAAPPPAAPAAPPQGATRLAPPPAPPQPAAEPPAPPPAAAAAAPPPPPPPPPPPAQPAAAAPPPPPPPPAAAPAPPLRAAVGPGEPMIYATPGRAPVYIPPGVPPMAPSVRVAPGSPPMGGRVAYPSPAFVEHAAPAAPSAPPPAQAAAPSAAAGAPTPVYPARGFVVHHSGGSSLNALATTLQQRGLGAQYLMDRDGTVYAFGGAGSRQMQPNDKWGGVAPGLSNHNTVGMEVVAKDDKDVTPAQVASARAFIAANYPTTPVYGHGEVNPGHKQATEGMTIVKAVRADRTPPAPDQVASAGPGAVVAFPSPAFTEPGTADVGYPSGAPAPPVDYRGVPFRQTYPDLSPAALGVVPRPRPGVPTDIGAPAGPRSPLLGPLTEPGTGVPLSGISVRDRSGREQTYTVPSPAAGDVAANMQLAGITDFRSATPDQVTEYKRLVVADQARQKLVDADIARARGPTPAAQVGALNVFNGYRQALDRYQADFPTPEERAKYIGWLNQPLHSLKAFAQADPRFKQFLADTAPFQYHNLDDSKGDINQQEQVMLGDLLPTGHESDAASHEQRLQKFNDLVNERHAMLTAQLAMTPDEIADPAWWNAANQAVKDQQLADKQAAGGGVAGAAIGAALSAPSAGAPPAPPPAAVIVAAPAPTAPPAFTVLGHWQE